MTLPSFLNLQQTETAIVNNFTWFREGGPGKYTPLCLHGVKGVGKTTIVNGAAKRLGESLGLNIGVIQLSLSTMQPFTLNGYPFINEVKINGTKVNVQSHAMPEILAKASEYDYLVIFLDEMNRARPEMHNSIMGLLDGRGIGEHAIPNNVFVIAAVNPSNEDYANVTDMEDEAFLDRVFHINVATSESETLTYMYSDKSIHPAVYSFLNEDNERIQKKKDFESITTRLNPSDRSYAVVGRFINFVKDRAVQEAVAKGLLGDSTGDLFVQRLNKHEALFSVDQILNEWNAAKGKVIKEAVTPDDKGQSRLDVVSKLNDTIVIHLSQSQRDELTKKQMKNLKKYMDLIPHDHQNMIASKGKFKGAEIAEFSPQLSEVLDEGNLDLSSVEFR